MHIHSLPPMRCATGPFGSAREGVVSGRMGRKEFSGRRLESRPGVRGAVIYKMGVLCNRCSAPIFNESSQPIAGAVLPFKAGSAFHKPLLSAASASYGPQGVARTLRAAVLPGAGHSTESRPSRKPALSAVPGFFTTTPSLAPIGWVRLRCMAECTGPLFLDTCSFHSFFIPRAVAGAAGKLWNSAGGRRHRRMLPAVFFHCLRPTRPGNLRISKKQANH